MNNQGVEYNNPKYVNQNHEALLSTLEGLSDRKEKQEILNQFFPQSRRQEMFTSSSRDIEGRPVCYYRKMNWHTLLKLLKIGELNALDHFPNPDEPADKTELKYFLARRLEGDERLDMIRNNDYATILEMTMPGLSIEEKAVMLGEPTYRQLLPIFERHFDRRFMRSVHTGSVDQKFSSAISLSVGGIISDHLRPARVYVELIIPDEEVEVHPEHVRGEKEVFVRRIKSEWISRVYVDPEQMRDELIADQNSNIGRFVTEKDLQNNREVERWRWDEPTENYLPKDLLSK